MKWKPSYYFTVIRWMSTFHYVMISDKLITLTLSRCGCVWLVTGWADPSAAAAPSLPPIPGSSPSGRGRTGWERCWGSAAASQWATWGWGLPCQTWQGGGGGWGRMGEDGVGAVLDAAAVAPRGAGCWWAADTAVCPLASPWVRLLGEAFLSAGHGLSGCIQVSTVTSSLSGGRAVRRENGGRSESCHVALDLMVERRDETGHPAKNIQVRNHKEFKDLFCVFFLCI